MLDFGRSPVAGELLYHVFELEDELGVIYESERLFGIFGYLSDTVEAQRWGLISLDAATGEVYEENNVKVATTLANGTTITRNNTRKFYQQGLLVDYGEDYVYSCLIYKASEMHDEIALTQHDAATLEAITNLEFSRGYVPLESCHIQEQLETGLIVMAIGTFEYTHIFAFENVLPTDVDGTNALKNVTDIGLVYYHQRYVPFKIQLFETQFADPASNFFSLFIRTMGFDQNDDKIFMTKFSDVTSPIWASPCTDSEIQFNTTSTFYLSMNTEESGVGINGIAVNALKKWTSLDFSFKQVSNLTLNDFYSKNPQKFVQTIDVEQEHVYRANFLNCSRYSFPTYPEEIISEDSEIASLSASIKVGQYPSVFTFNPFMSCSYDEITHKIVYQDNTTVATFLDFDNQDLTLTVNADDNEYAGYYLLQYRAFVTEDPTFVRNYDFILNIDANEPPYPVLNGFTDDYTLYTGHTKNWTVTLDFDPEGDEAIFDAILLDTTGTEVINSTWFSVVSSNATTLVFMAREPPLVNALTGDQFYINVSISDAFNYDTPRTYQISVTIQKNTAPYLDFTKQQLQLPSAYIAVEFSFTLHASDFIDDQGDDPVFNCDILSTVSSSWIQHEQTSTSLTFSGAAQDNDLSGTYYFVCAVTDQYLPTINFYQFVLPVFQNQDVLMNNMTDVTLINRDYHVWSDLALACVDPESQPITRTISITKNGSPIVSANLAAAGFLWDETIPMLAFDFKENTQQGEYIMTMTCFDGFNPLSDPDHQNVIFKLTAIQNDAPEVTTYSGVGDDIDPLALIEHVVLSSSAVPIVFEIDISGLFTDPEYEQLYYDVVDISNNALDPTDTIAQVQDDILRITIVNSDVSNLAN